jgi:hypothetical protein
VCLDTQRVNFTVVKTDVPVMIPFMWTASRDQPGPISTLRLRLYTGDECLSYANFLTALAEEASFRDLILEQMQTAPFVAYRWETPPLTADNIDRPFECLFHDSPDLDVRADPTEFRSYFQPGEDVVSFDNLGGDALLVVPCPTSSSANYSHIGAFHRTAPRSQRHAFWVAVAQSVLERISSRPLWLSTAGGGVDWLHARLDSRPKYYRHFPWRTNVPGGEAISLH